MKKAILITLLLAPSLALASHPENPVDFTPGTPPPNFDASRFDVHSEPSCRNGLGCGGGTPIRPEEWKSAYETQTCAHWGADCIVDLSRTEWYRKQMLELARQLVFVAKNWGSFRDLQVPDGSGKTFGYWIDQVR